MVKRTPSNDDPRKPLKSLRLAAEADPFAEELSNEDISGALNELIAEHGTDDLRVVVSKRSLSPGGAGNARGGQLERIGEYTYPGEFDPDAIAKEYGGGYYCYTAKNPGGVIQRKWHTTYAIKQIPLGLPDVTAANAAVESANNKVLDVLMKTMDDRKNEAAGTMAQMVALFASMVQMSQNQFNTILGVMKSDGGPKSNPIEDIIKIQGLIDGVRSKGGKAVDDLNVMLGVLEKGITIGAGAGEQKSDDGLVDKLMNGIGNILSTRAGVPPAAPAPTVHSAIRDIKDTVMGQKNDALMAAAGQLPPAVDDPDMELEDEVFTLVNSSMKVILSQAREDIDPSKVVGFLRMWLTDNDFSRLSMYLSRYGVANLVSYFVDLKPYEGWMIRLKDSILKITPVPAVMGTIPPVSAEAVGSAAADDVAVIPAIVDNPVIVDVTKPSPEKAADA